MHTHDCDHARVSRRKRRGYFFAGVVLVCAIVSCVWLFDVNHSTLQAWATLPRPSEGRLPYPTVGHRYDPKTDIQALGWNENSISDALGQPAEDVQSSAFLITVAHVYDSDAQPIRGARVVFTLSSESGTQTNIDHTNARGSASCMRWIPAGAQGQPMIVTAEATADGWIGATSRWFVPE